MPQVQFVRGTIWNREPREPGEVAEVSERDAYILCDGYKDAVRIDGAAPKAPTGMTVREQIQTRDPVAEHRDPVVEPTRRRK